MDEVKIVSFAIPPLESALAMFRNEVLERMGQPNGLKAVTKAAGRLILTSRRRTSFVSAPAACQPSLARSIPASSIACAFTDSYESLGIFTRTELHGKS